MIPLHGTLMLTADHRRGTWGSELRLKTGKMIRTAGQTSTSASAHTLLMIALRNALFSVTSQQMRKLTGRQGRRARLHLIVSDPAFAHGLWALISGSKSESPLRAGRNLIQGLTQELARFDITLETDADDRLFRFHALDRWSAEHIIRPKTLPSTFAPSAVAVTEAA